MEQRPPQYRIYLAGILSCIVSSWIALKLGAVSDAPLDLIVQVRLPRVILAAAIGMGLSVAGAVLQALFSNPLCEPYTLGVSSGAALGAVLGASAGIEWAVSGLAGSAFVGALSFAGILYFISLKKGQTQYTLLLAGVMMGFLGSSLVALWMALSDTNGVQSAMSWLLGDLSRARLSGAVFGFFGILLLIFSIWKEWRSLDALLMGEEGALSLGVDVPKVRRKLVLLVSLLIGLCVSGGGMIGFVGLVIPHFSRRWVGSLHLSLIPICALWGASTLIFADCLSRVLVKPNELPVGVVTALIGAPLFILILLKRRTLES